MIRKSTIFTYLLFPICPKNEEKMWWAITFTTLLRLLRLLRTTLVVLATRFLWIMMSCSVCYSFAHLYWQHHPTIITTTISTTSSTTTIVTNTTKMKSAFMHVSYKNANKNSFDETKQIKNYLSRNLFRQVLILIHTSCNDTYILYVDQYLNVWVVLMIVSLFLFSCWLVASSSVNRSFDL